jgi:hypothetical protein
MAWPQLPDGLQVRMGQWGRLDESDGSTELGMEKIVDRVVDMNETTDWVVNWDGGLGVDFARVAGDADANLALCRFGCFRLMATSPTEWP